VGATYLLVTFFLCGTASAHDASQSFGIERFIELGPPQRDSIAVLASLGGHFAQISSRFFRSE
jgi:hypothetical protein